MNVKTKMKKVVAFLLVTMLLVPNILWAQEEKLERPKMSLWAASSIQDALQVGIIPKEWNSMPIDFTKPITQEQYETLLDRTAAKIKRIGAASHGAFEPVALKNDRTRGDIVNQIYNMIARHAFDRDITPVEYAKMHFILAGRNEDLALERVCTLEEAIVLLSRSVTYAYARLEEGGKGFTWVVKNNENTVYMLGSIHVANSTIYPLDARLQKAFYTSDFAYFELDLVKSFTKTDVMENMMKLEEGKTLKDVLDPELYNEVMTIAGEMGINKDELNKYKPWAVADLLGKVYDIQTSQGESDKTNPLYGIDFGLNVRGYLYGIPVRELEGIEYQAKFYDKYMSKNQIERLEYVIHSIKTKNPTGFKANEEALQGWLKMWADGDKEAFQASYDALYKENPESINPLVGERDVNMAKKIDEMLKADGKNNYFVVAGAAHFFSHTNIIKQLEKMGYKVEAFYDEE